MRGRKRSPFYNGRVAEVEFGVSESGEIMNILSLLSVRNSWRVLLVVALLLVSVATFGQAKQYQTGAITEVKVHQRASDKDAKTYDVSVKVGNKIYVVLFTPPAGSDVIEYKVGQETTVLVDGKNLNANDLTGKTWKLPILSQREVSEKKDGQ